MKVRMEQVYAEVAKNLNERGVMPFSAREWTVGNIKRIAYNEKLNEPVVRAEIKKVISNHLKQQK